MTVKLLTKHHLEFLSIKGGCRGSSESTLVKMPHCWKSHVAAQILISPLLSHPRCHLSVHWMYWKSSTWPSSDIIVILKWCYHKMSYLSKFRIFWENILTLNAPIATKFICFSCLRKCLRNFYGKQCGPRSDCSYRSSLFWVHAVFFYT